MFGVGGVKGLVYIGVIEEIEVVGFDVVVIVGILMGVLIGGIYVMGKFDVYCDWVIVLVKIDVLCLFDWIFFGGGFIKGEKLIGMLCELIGDVYIEELLLVYIVVVIDLECECEVWFICGLLFDVICVFIVIFIVFWFYCIDG